MSTQSSHSLKIKNNEIKLDDFKLKCVTNYEVKSSDVGVTELTLKIIIDSLDVIID